MAVASDRLSRLADCDLICLHVHLSTRRDLASFGRRVEHLVAVAGAVFGRDVPAVLDLGGGMYGPLPDTLRRHFGGDVPSWDDIASEVASVLGHAYPGPETPALVIEPGVAVVADVMRFVCRVVAVKRQPSRGVAIVTGSVQNIRAGPDPVRLPLHVAADPTTDRSDRLAGPLDVTGYTCLEGDILYPDYDGILGIGDFLVFGNVGAYATVFKPPFIRPAPPVLARTDGTEGPAIARRSETLDDLLTTYASAGIDDAR
jgi:diaminopimelate decarboxylase